MSHQKYYNQFLFQNPYRLFRFKKSEGIYKQPFIPISSIQSVRFLHLESDIEKNSLRKISHFPVDFHTV